MKVNQIPNIITLIRLLSTFILVALLMLLNSGRVYNEELLSIIIAILFTASMCTDLIDGYLARKYSWGSTFGKLVDPLADKMLFLSVMIMMIPLGRIPAWIVALLFIREVMVTSLRGLAVEQGLIISASHWGKYKSAFISSAIVGLLMPYEFLGIHWQLIGWILLIPGFVFSIFSGIHYSYGYFKQYGLK